MIVSSKRHLHQLCDLSDEELTDFIMFLAKMRKAMKEVLGIDQVKIVQSESSHHHFHFWIFPITDEFKEKFGTGIASVRPALDYSKDKMNTKENLEKVESDVENLRAYDTANK